jgi:hypothetical protein
LRVDVADSFSLPARASVFVLTKINAALAIISRSFSHISTDIPTRFRLTANQTVNTEEQFFLLFSIQ